MLGPTCTLLTGAAACWFSWRCWAGIALNNTRAVIEALAGQRGPFVRTPKFQLEGRTGRWVDSAYRLSLDWSTLGEAALALYAVITMVAAWQAGNLYAVPFLLLYAAGFGLTAGLGAWQAWVIPQRSGPLDDPAKTAPARAPAGSSRPGAELMPHSNYLNAGPRAWTLRCLILAVGLLLLCCICQPAPRWPGPATPAATAQDSDTDDRTVSRVRTAWRTTA
jgi:hypothetical protein